MLDYQGMVCLAANQVWWTAEVENVFEKVKQVRWFSVFGLHDVWIRSTISLTQYLTFINK
jgi:hypothetical protein